MFLYTEEGHVFKTPPRKAADSGRALTNHQFFKRLAEGFRGRLHAVNPGEDAVAGIATYRKVEDVPGPIDVLIALVPAPSLVALDKACRPSQVRFLLAVPSGFAEVAKDGPELQRKLIEAARRRGIRVLGPNIVGIMNGVLGLNASMMPELPPGGVGLSCLTQSGGFGMALSMYALARPSARSSAILATPPTRTARGHRLLAQDVARE
jgi:acyl-CoA synthetase (NDP forming)